MMKIPEVPPAGEVLKSTHAKSLYRRTVRVFATFVLAISFALAGATVATAAPASGDCNGHYPGCCYGATR